MPARTSVEDMSIAKLVGIGARDVAAAMVVMRKPGAAAGLIPA